MSNNTDKLLRAFIEASGFDIEKVFDTKETTISEREGLRRIAESLVCAPNHNLVVVNGQYKRGADGCYYIKASIEVDYKVTRKGEDHWDYCGVIPEPEFTRAEQVKFLQNEIDRLLKEDE